MICNSSGNCFEKTTFYFDGIRDNSDKAHFHCELVYWNLCLSYRIVLCFHGKNNCKYIFCGHRTVTLYLLLHNKMPLRKLIYSLF